LILDLRTDTLRIVEQVKMLFPVFAKGARMTNFYPRYNDANDQVDRISRIRPITFQRVIPRYRLSTSETRDAGTGPAFDEIPVSSAPVEQRVEFYRTSKPYSHSDQGEAKGSIIDLYA
jgi:hypothetical protein